jgi:alpha-tubulin suppressor-like RCC1 family protein
MSTRSIARRDRVRLDAEQWDGWPCQMVARMESENVSTIKNRALNLLQASVLSSLTLLMGTLTLACTASDDIAEDPIRGESTAEIESNLAPQQGTTIASFSSLGYSAVAAGEYHTLALRKDGRVFAAGTNANGELGNGTQTTTYGGAPTQVISLSGVTAIAAGCNHSLALTATGEVWGWGYNHRGQVGVGAVAKQLTPVKVSGLPTIKAIAAGCTHSMALDSAGYVWTWGYNVYGQLGNGNTTSSSSPFKITGFLASAIDGGEAFSLALRIDGTVMAWGNNAYGQLARGNTTSSTLPVITQLTGITGISAGANHGLAIKGNDVLAWGNNAQGAVGTGSTTPSIISSPQVIGSGFWWGLSATDFSAGRSFSLVGTSDGFGPPPPGWYIFDWGSNTYGQLGVGTTSSTLQIVGGGLYSNEVFDIVFLEADYPVPITLSAGGYHSVAINHNGQVVAWGRNLFGQLGNGSTANTAWARTTLFP